MKKTFAALAFLAALPLAAAAQVSKEDIKKLVAAGVSEDVVLTYVRANGPAPRMSADDLIELKQAGAGEKVLAALASGTTSAPAPRPQVVEQPAYAPQTTYVYSTPPASSYWCSSHYSYDGCSTYVRPVVSYGYYPSYYGGYGYYGGGYCGPSYYRRPYYSGYYGGYYGGRCGSGARVGVSIGWRW
ncbi:MAG TPA: hypothetical protein VF950_17880 [Planctomycetota bacterium]